MKSHLQYPVVAFIILGVLTPRWLWAHAVPLHKTMAVHAMKRTERIIEQGRVLDLCQAYKDEIYDGSHQEDDVVAIDEFVGNPCRSKNHGYNPITNTTGGPTFTAGQALCAVTPLQTAKDYAVDLWAQMESAFSAGTLEGGDTVGAYHYLGRCAHLVQDMSSAPHVHPGNIFPLTHKAYEDEENVRYECQTCSSWLVPLDDSLSPLDALPSEATLKLDSHSSQRLQTKTYATDEVDSFVDVMARITYFQSTFWGEVTFGSSSSGGATSSTTSSATFGDGTVGSQSNTLHVMFDDGSSGNGPEVRYVNGGFPTFDDRFEIVALDPSTSDPSDTFVHSWMSDVDDEWFPCDGDGVYQDGAQSDIAPGQIIISSGDRAVGRFHFASAYGDGGAPPVQPLNYPNGDSFPGSQGFSHLGEYISYYGMRLGMRYNAGLIEKAQKENIAGGTVTQNNPNSGLEVRQTFELTQDVYPAADAEQLSFTTYNQNDAVINGWLVALTSFGSSTSSQINDYSIDVDATGGSIIYNECVKINVTHWLAQNNTILVKDVEWVDTGKVSAKAMPDHGWKIGPPVPIGGGLYKHTFTLINDDPVAALRVEGVKLLASGTFLANLGSVPFAGSSLTPPPLIPGQTWSTDVITLGAFVGGHIYFRYEVFDVTGTTVVCQTSGDHPVEDPSFVGDLIDTIQRYTDLGLPDSPLAGLPVTVQGIVTAPVGVFDFATHYVEDATGGLQIFDVTPPGVEIGDLVEVTGMVSDFDGEIRVADPTWTILGSPGGITPLPLAPSQVLDPDHSGSKTGEDYELVGRLLAVAGTVVFTGPPPTPPPYEGSFGLTDPNGGLLPVFVDGDTGIDGSFLEEGASFEIVGLLSNVNGVVQLQPRYNQDITRISTAVFPVELARRDAFIETSFPNPFNPSTAVRFVIPRRGFAELVVYDSRGAAVRTLFRGTLDPGSYDRVWNGRDDRGRTVASGVYFARLRHENARPHVRKLTLIK